MDLETWFQIHTMSLILRWCPPKTIQIVDRKWGFWLIDLGKFQNWDNLISPEFSRKIKNKNKNKK